MVSTNAGGCGSGASGGSAGSVWVTSGTNAGSRTVTFRLFRGGAMVHTVKGPLVSTDLSVSGGKAISVDFGIGRVADGAYFPPIGWKYSNLNVKAEPF